MKYLTNWSSIFIAAGVTFAIFVFRNRKHFRELIEEIVCDFNEGKYIKQYGRCGRVYAQANKKKLQVEDVKIERNNKVRFFVPSKDTFVEGIFIGVDKDGLLYVRIDSDITEDSGDIVAYEAKYLKKKHIVYVKPLLQ